MKQTVLVLLATLGMVACKAQEKSTAAPAVPAPAVAPTPAATPVAFVQWDTRLIDLGKVKKGEKRELFFTFTNTSGKEVQIDLVDACHCTTTDYPRGIIPPGGKARVDAIFDSTEKEASETIDIRVIFKQNHPNGDPIIETVQYKFELL